MPTIKELLEEIHADKNAVSAVNKGLTGVEGFAKVALSSLESGARDEGLACLRNLVTLVEGLKTAVPANVTPASVGPVGKSPHEQYLEQAATIVKDSLAQMQLAVEGVNSVLAGINTALGHVMQASAALQSPDLKAKP